MLRMGRWPIRSVIGPAISWVRREPRKSAVKTLPSVTRLFAVLAARSGRAGPSAAVMMPSAKKQVEATVMVPRLLSCLMVAFAYSGFGVRVAV